MSANSKPIIKAFLGAKLLVFALIANEPVTANDFTAEKVMKEMKPEQQFAYIAGVVEGLAVARYMKDGKKKEGMECIYDWFYDDKSSLKIIMDAFDKFSSYPPGSIIDTLTKRKCGQ